ncbi:hypothetical protein IAD21_04059 [Abditibacteriota bacterium]|nr:hypothetical protein IAD21_04059 [Abditibacteriota bacterium]
MSSFRKFSKAEKSLFVLCVFAVLPMAGVVYFYGKRDAEPEWKIPPAVPRPNPNGYDFYVAAARATVRFKPEVDFTNDTTTAVHTPGSPYALKNYSLARRQQWLKANAPTFALVNKGLTTPSMAPDTTTKPTSDWSSLRQLARDMSVRARTFQMQKQPMRATMSALDTMQMGQDTTRRGGLIARLVGVAIVALGRAPLDDWNKTVNELNAREARTATSRLEAMIARDQTLSQTQTIAKRDSLLELKGIFDVQGWRRLSGPLSNSGLAQNAFELWRSQTISKQTIHDNMIRALDNQIAIAKMPYSKSQSALPLSDLDMFTKNFTVTGGRMSQNEARHATSNTMLLLRLALRAYIAEHGTAPPTLSALVPDYLKNIPTDVYSDGKPLFYTSQGKTYKLWSVGPDMTNNGGVPLARKPGAKTLAPVQNTLSNTGDFVAGLCR